MVKESLLWGAFHFPDLRKLHYIFLLIPIILLACDEGELNPKSPPDTSIFINSIELSGENRLTSVVDLFWIGTDKDGFVKEYEISFDQIEWSLVTRTDSTFKFTISEGSDTANIDFYVRSIDNDGLIDPTPAYLEIPIRNTAPTIQFDEDFQPVDTTSVVFSLIWNVLDLDGENTIDSTFIRINDGDWFAIDGGKNSAMKLRKLRQLEVWCLMVIIQFMFRPRILRVL